MTDCERAIKTLAKDGDAAMLTGWTTRVIKALAHLRECWCIADFQNRAHASLAIMSLRNALRLRESNAVPLAERVLCDGIDPELAVELLRETAPGGSISPHSAMVLALLMTDKSEPTATSETELT